jgi:hypothetical protein
MIRLIRRWFKIHFLYRFFLFLNLLFYLFNFFRNLLHKPFHNGILFIQINKNIQQLFPLILNPNFSNPNLFSNLIKTLFNFHLFHNTFLILIIDSWIFLFLDLNLFLILFYLLLKFLELLFLDKFWFYEMFEFYIMLDLVV